ncbi:MAG TPA: M20/M25/M40 family metallo-hydrolase [Holophagaceae bacterium]|nr:M20/M25/M40 family metallo-hydrolase [Holophagaceae bacterium]
MNEARTDSQLAEATKWLLELCAVEAPSGAEDALLPRLRWLLTELGAEITLQSVAPGRTNVLATWGVPRVLFSTHLDTVPPYVAPTLHDGAVWGRGACDARGQIVAQLFAIRRLIDEGQDGLAWLGVVGEESDSAGARAALGLADRFQDALALINGEPTELKLASGQRGLQHWCLRCEGRNAHSGSPEEGRSAVLPLLDWIQALRGLERPSDPELGPEVWNLGLLQAGEAINVIPAHAEAHVLARTLPGSDFAARLQALAPASGHAELRLEEAPDRYPAVDGFEQRPMPFGSDAPTLRALIPSRTVVLAGPGSIRVAHTEDEHLRLEDLEAGIALNRRLALHFFGRMGGEGSKRGA